MQTKDIEKHAKAYEKQLKHEQQYNVFVRAHQSITEAFNINPKTANTTNIPLPKTATPYWDVESIINAISYRADAFVRDILGPPLSRISSATTYRYSRKKGSLHVAVRGNKAGLWYDFATCEGGNLLSLLERERNLRFKEALQ